MNNLNFQELFSIYNQISPISKKNNLIEFEKIKSIIEGKMCNPSASIIIFGVYNAGKSSLINALVGSNIAKVSDKPETDAVTSYPWKEFLLKDTPGIDAPIEHQIITEKEITSSDAVIFVINPRGVVEEKKTLDQLINLIEQRKQVFLVLNKKDILDPSDEIKIKDELSQRLQQIARKRNLSGILKNIPILYVNANSALKGKIENKQKMLHRSGLPELEDQLLSFLRSIQDENLIESTAQTLRSHIQKTIAVIQKKQPENSTQHLDQFAASLAKQEISLRNSMGSALQAKEAWLTQNIGSILRSSPEQAQQSIQRMFESCNQELLGELESHLRMLEREAEAQIKHLSLHLDLPKASNNPHIDLKEIKDKDTGHDFTQEKKNSDERISIDPNMISLTLESIAKYLPAQISKFIPVIGPVITVLQGIYNMFGSSSEEDQFRAQEKARQEAQERRDQAILDLSKKLAWEYKDQQSSHIFDTLRNSFKQVLQQVDSVRNTLSEAEQQLSEDRQALEHQLARLGT